VKRNDLPQAKYVLISQLARILADPTTGKPTISIRTLRRWAENGEIPASKRGGGRWYVDLDELRETFRELNDRKPGPYEAPVENVETDDE